MTRFYAFYKPSFVNSSLCDWRGWLFGQFIFKLQFEQLYMQHISWKVFRLTIIINDKMIVMWWLYSALRWILIFLKSNDKLNSVSFVNLMSEQRPSQHYEAVSKMFRWHAQATAESQPHHISVQTSPQRAYHHTYIIQHQQPPTRWPEAVDGQRPLRSKEDPLLQRPTAACPTDPVLLPPRIWRDTYGCLRRYQGTRGHWSEQD